MYTEQLKIDYPKETAVFCKIDYYTAVFYNSSFEKVLNDFLELGFDFSDPVLQSTYTRQAGYEDVICYTFGSGRVTAAYKNVVEDGESPFDTIYESVRLELSGKALDELRNHYDYPDYLDTVLHKFLPPDELGQRSMSVTRCDFAFDFVNYKFNIYERCREELRSLASENGTIKVKGRCRPVNFSVRSGAERTIYIGSNKSEKLIRIYDKAFEIQCKKGGIGKLPDPSINYDVKMWHRVEFQCRREWAEYFLLNAQDYLQVLKYVYSEYAFQDQQGNVTEFWQDLFDWILIPSIVQNAKYEHQKLTVESLKRQYRLCLFILNVFMAWFGKEKVFNDAILNFENAFSDEFYNSYQTRKILQRISILSGNRDYTHLKGAEAVSKNGNVILKLK